MAKQGKSPDIRRISSELLALTYGAHVTQLIEDFEDDEQVNFELEKMGYNIGIRIIEDFLARTNSERCNDLREVADAIAKQGFKMYLGVSGRVDNWSSANDEFSIILETNPLADFVELPKKHLKTLNYSNILCGVIRGALESIQISVEVSFVRDTLKDDTETELRVKFIERLSDAIPAGEE